VRRPHARSDTTWLVFGASVRCRVSSSDSIAAGLLSRLVLELLFNLLLFRGARGFDALGTIAPAELPLHELVEGAIRVRRELLVCAFFGELAVCANAQNAVGALDGRETMRDTDGGVVVQ
jgi:hypothetical protein